MAEQNQLTLEQSLEYKSIEQKIGEKVLRPTGQLLYNFTRGFYEGAASFFRIPTSIRKFKNKQDIAHRYTNGKSPLEQNALAMGISIGLFVTGLSDYLLLIDPKVFNSLQNLLYTQLATNIASGVYELGRLDKSRQEYNLIKEKKSKKVGAQ